MSRNGGQSLLKFMYNADGIRTNKIVDGVNHVYTLNGTQIVSEAWGTNLLIYLYDESGAPIGMQYRTNSYAANVFDTFYFEMNLQGDIVAVYNADCDKIGSYNYDAWGNFTVTVESTNTPRENRMVWIFNPFRYRGYYYDADTGLYYLQSRYYNPQWGRFLNADGYVNANGDLIGFNMYAYCSNNSVMYVDYTGHSWKEFWDDLNTVAGLLNLFNNIRGASIEVAVISAVIRGKGGDLIDDFKNGALNPFNQDESIALDAKVLGFYKGETVIRHSIPGLSSWQIIGVIYLNTDVKNNQDGYDTINHEWGHGVQERIMGTANYAITIALPSMINCQFGRYQNYQNTIDRDRIYYSKVWERTADLFGGVQGRVYDPLWDINSYLPW